MAGCAQLSTARDLSSEGVEPQEYCEVEDALISDCFCDH